MTTGSKALSHKVCLWTLIAQETKQKVMFPSEHLGKPVGILGEYDLAKCDLNLTLWMSLHTACLETE